MPWDLVFFYVIAAVSVLSALGVVATNNPVHSGVFLVICFLNVAGIFVMLGAEFLAVTQVIVYTGAILVLVLFVLMLIDPDDLPEFHTARPVQRYVGFLLGAVLLLEIGAAIITWSQLGPDGTATAENIALVGGNTQALGRTLYTEYLFPFEVASLVLLVGVIGAIVLALPERLGERIGQRRGTISLGHPRGTDLALPIGPLDETLMDAPVAASAQTIVRQPSPEATRELIMVSDAETYTTIGSNGVGRT